MTPPSNRLLWRLAWGNVVLHGAGLILALFGMRPGSALVPLSERMEYLAGHPAAWSWGWGVWMVCSLLLLGYVAALRSRLPSSTRGLYEGSMTARGTARGTVTSYEALGARPLLERISAAGYESC